MKTLTTALLFITILLYAPFAQGQANLVFYPESYQNGGAITASVASTSACPITSCIGLTIPSPATTITVGVTGTFSATLQPEESQDGGFTWTSAGAAITTPGTTSYTITGFTNFRVRASAYTSGIANINIQAGPSGGNGSATAGVTSLNGLVGGVNLVGGSGITVTPSGSNITIASTGGGGTVTGSGVANQVAFWTGASAIGGNAGLTFDPSTLSLQNTGGATTNSFLAAGPSNLDVVQVNGASGVSIVALESGHTLILDASGNAQLASSTGFVNLGVAGATNPGFCMPGFTSGSACFTPPAVAGTVTNPVVSSNALNAPVIGATGTGGVGGALQLTEGTAPASVAGKMVLYGNNSNGRLFLSANGGGFFPLAITPTSTTNNELASFNGTTGGAFQDSGVAASGGTLTATLYATSTNCAAVGTSASPSVVSCTAAAAGAFSCAVAASAATCTINTTAVTANSEIFVQEVADEGTRLSVTCNTAPTVTPAIVLATKTAGTGFTINMPTIATNPACFDYHIIN